MLNVSTRYFVRILNPAKLSLAVRVLGERTLLADGDGEAEAEAEAERALLAVGDGEAEDAVERDLLYI